MMLQWYYITFLTWAHYLNAFGGWGIVDWRLQLQLCRWAIGDSLGATYTIGSKIIRALVIIRVRKFLLNTILWNKHLQIMIFRLYAVHNKHDDSKIGDQIRKILKYYSKCSNNFAADCSSSSKTYDWNFEYRPIL